MSTGDRKRERLRATFDQAAELYDRARLGYPPALFTDLAQLAGVGPGCRVLEIGCGTGHATVPLADTPEALRLPTAAEVPSSSEELDRSGRFGPASFRRYQWD